MEPHFADNCRSLTEKLHALREPDDLCFALLAGTAVSDFADHTDENIRAGMPKLITLNAWNEWTEGCYLEPSKEFGYGFLNAVARVFGDCGQAK